MSDADLLAALRPYRCCGCPQMCGARCQDDELSHVLAQAERLLAETLAERERQP